MADFTNPNIQHIYDSNGVKHAININHDVLYKDFDDDLKGVFLSNYGKYYTQKVKSYGTLHETLCIF